MDLKIIKNTIKIGIEKPFKLLHMTDTHITHGDPTGWNRKGTFDVDYDGCTEDYFFKALNYAKENNMPILHTGDIIDFFSEENFEFIDKHLKDVDYIYAAGNHDFCHFLGRAKEDYDYKWEKIKDIAPHIKNNLYFYSRVINGVNIVTMDNSYYFIDNGQLEALKAEVAKGYPIILAMHIPFYTEALRATAEEDKIVYAIAAPEEVVAEYTPERRMQMAPDRQTLEAVEYIKNEPMIKALITGHRHLNLEEMISEGLPQFVTHGTFAGYVREFSIE